MQKKYLIGIDVGTQSAKAVVFDLLGETVCSSSVALKPIAIPAPQQAVHSDEDIWDCSKKALKKLMQEFLADPNHQADMILAAGLCAIRCCRVLLQANGELAYPVISWMDKRLNEAYKHQPEFGDVKYVTTTSGYLTYRLTGERKDTCANYIGAWPMDDFTGEWHNDTVIQQAGLKREMLFDVVKPGTVLGKVTANVAAETLLPEGLPIVATAHDKAVESLGSGSLDQGTALISLGTYVCAIINGKSEQSSAQNFWPFQAAVPGKFLYECMGVRRGMWIISWFCQQFAPGVEALAKDAGLSLEDWFNREAMSVPAGCEGLLTVHDWAPPAEHPYRKGIMFGFDGRHGRAHMYRSLMEGMAFTLKNHMSPMLTELGIRLDKIIVSGGGAKSDLFLQIFADCFAVPVHRNEMTDAAALGSAICAGVAMQVFSDFETAAKQMVKSSASFTANQENHQIYDRLNREVYSKLSGSFDQPLEALNRIVD